MAGIAIEARRIAASIAKMRLRRSIAFVAHRNKLLSSKARLRCLALVREGQMGITITVCKFMCRRHLLRGAEKLQS